jgi:hypothetical protein
LSNSPRDKERQLARIIDACENVMIDDLLRFKSRPKLGANLVKGVAAPYRGRASVKSYELSHANLGFVESLLTNWSFLRRRRAGGSSPPAPGIYVHRNLRGRNPGFISTTPLGGGDELRGRDVD